MRRLILLLCFLVQAAYGQTQDSSQVALPQSPGAIKTTARIDTRRVPQNRTVTYTVTVSWEGDLDRYEIENVDKPVLTNLEMVGSASSNWVGEVRGVKQSRKTYEYILQPVDRGMAYVDGAVVEYRDNQEGKSAKLVTDRLEVEVVDPIIESDLRMWWLGAGGLVALLALGSAGFVFYRKRQEREAARLREAAERRPIEERYLADLKEAVDLKSQDVVGSFAALSKLCRHYLAEKYGFSALEITTSEIAEHLQCQAVSSTLVEHVRQILNQSDVAKFSGGQVEPGVLERVYTLLEDILNRNKSEQVSISVEENGGAQNS